MSQGLWLLGAQELVDLAPGSDFLFMQGQNMDNVHNGKRT